MNKNVWELSSAELRCLYQNNETLRHKVYDRAMESADFWAREYLDGLERCAADYKFGSYRKAFFNIKDFLPFYKWAQKVQRAYCFYSEEAYKDIEKCYSLYDKLQYPDYYRLSDKNYDRIESRYNELIASIEAQTADYIQSEYDADDQTLQEYFADFREDIIPQDAVIDLDTNTITRIYTVTETW